MATKRPKARVSESPWPTLEKQLADIKAPRDSALAKLIAANQDFSVLRPEEANDRLRIPPWARVLFRSSHPHVTYSATDPSGGYPMYLRSYVEWAELHPDLPVQKGPESNASAA